MRCPNNREHDQFVTTAHEVHDWVVDAEGNFIEDLGCSEVAVWPDTWTCSICGANAVESAVCVIKGRD